MKIMKFKTYRKENTVEEYTTLEVLANGEGFDTPFNDYIWVEYIGLNDRDEHEVYRGDILIDGNEKKWEVVFGEFTVQDKKGNVFNSYGYYIKSIEDDEITQINKYLISCMKVVGNIYLDSIE